MGSPYDLRHALSLRSYLIRRHLVLRCRILDLLVCQLQLLEWFVVGPGSALRFCYRSLCRYNSERFGAAEVWRTVCSHTIMAAADPNIRSPRIRYKFRCSTTSPSISGSFDPCILGSYNHNSALLCVLVKSQGSIDRRYKLWKGSSLMIL